MRIRYTVWCPRATIQRRAAAFTLQARTCDRNRLSLVTSTDTQPEHHHGIACITWTFFAPNLCIVEASHRLEVLRLEKRKREEVNLQPLADAVQLHPSLTTVAFHYA